MDRVREHKVPISVRNMILIFAPGTVATVLGLAGLVRAVTHLVRLPEQLDFTQFYLAAYIFRIAPGSSFYDVPVLQRYAEAVGIANFMSPNYPPFIALLFFPLSLLPFRVASFVWLGFNAILVLLFIIWGWSNLPSSRVRAKWFIAWFVLLLPAVADSLLLGQVNPILGLLLLIAVQGVQLQGKWRWIAGVSLAIAGAIKLWPLLLIGFFVIRRRFLVSGVAAISFVVITASSAIIVGPDSARQYFIDQLPQSGIQAAQAAYPNNQSIWGVTGRLFVGGTAQSARLSTDNVEDVSIVPLLQADLAYWIATAGFILTTVVGLFWITVSLRARSPVQEIKVFWAVLLGILTLLPFSWNHYSFLLMFPIMTLLVSDEKREESVLSLGAFCLLLTLVHRYWAWLPPLSALLAFVFAAEVLVEYWLIISARRNSTPHLRQSA